MTRSCIIPAFPGVLRTLIIVLLTLPAAVAGQIHSIAAGFDYTTVLGKRLDVRTASAIGGGAELRLLVSGPLSIGVGAGYASYSIEQPDALNRWGWQFWNERYSLKIESDLRANPNLSVQIGSVQSMSVIPVTLSAIYSTGLGESVMIAPRVGGGVAFYTRRLYADETWSKQFPQADYTLTYNLRNFAPDKKGNVAFGVLGCDVALRVASDVDVTAGVLYRLFFSASSGSGDFPFSNEAQAKLGVTFLY